MIETLKRTVNWDGVGGAEDVTRLQMVVTAKVNFARDNHPFHR
jgi:hypothetical protein